MKYIIPVMFLAISSGAFAQSPAEYICDKFSGSLSEKVEGRDFMGETYRCDVEKQWDMMIQSKINDLLLSDNYFGNGQGWKKTFVNTGNYNRLSFSFESDNYYIVNLYVPYEKKTDRFYISE